MPEPLPPDVLTCGLKYARAHLCELLAFARQPGQSVRIIDARMPSRAVWLGMQPPEGWQDDSAELAAVYARNIAAGRWGRRGRQSGEAAP